MVKCCTKCNIVKELPLFVKCTRNKSGYKAICKECRKQTRIDKSNPEYKKQWYLKNKERILEKVNAKYTKKGPRPKTYKSDLLYIKTYRAWWKANNEKYKKDQVARKAARRASKIKATPKWSNLDLIKEIYRNRPKGYHVDHILPLKGKLVCGLHVPNNLQYLPAIENIKKSNKYEVA